MPEPQMRWDITAVDRSRVAFQSFISNASRADRQMRAFVNTIRGGAAFAAGIIVVRELGKAIERDLGGSAKEFGDKWNVVINDWRVHFQNNIFTIASLIGQLIEKAKQWRATLPQGTEMTASGFVLPSNLLSQAEGAAGILTPLNGLGPQSQNKGDRLDITPENTTVANWRDPRKKKQPRGFSFERDVLRGLEEEIRLLEIRNRTMGQAESTTDALLTRERALNEIRRQGREPTEAEIKAIDERVAKIKSLTESMEAFEKAQEEAKKQMEFFQDLGASVTSSLDEAFTTLWDGQKLKIKDFVRSALGDLARLTLNKFVTGPIGNAFSNFASGLFGVGGASGAGGFSGASFAMAGASAAGGPARVNVYNMAGNTAVETRERTSANGMRELDFYIEDKANKAAGRAVKNAQPIYGGSPTLKRRT